MKANVIVYTLIFLLLLFSCVESLRLYLKERGHRITLERSFEAANKSLVYYKTKNGQLAAQNEVMNLKYGELKDIYPNIVKEIRNLDIKPQRVTQYAQTVVRQEKEIVTHLKDSIIRDTVVERTFSYQDRFYSVHGEAVGDTQRVHITSRDSLIQVVYKGPRYHPWLWVFSKRKFLQVITCKNPNSTVLFNQFIQIQGKP